MKYEVYTIVQTSYNTYKTEIIETFDNLEDAQNYTEGNNYLRIRESR